MSKTVLLIPARDDVAPSLVEVNDCTPEKLATMLQSHVTMSFLPAAQLVLLLKEAAPQEPINYYATIARMHLKDQYMAFSKACVTGDAILLHHSDNMTMQRFAAAIDLARQRMHSK
jgi:hypothetical protein